jgi:hypothetical protein
LNGKAIEFKSTNAGTTITFQGTINGDEIQFHRTVNVTGGYNGIFGGNGATEFVAHKGKATPAAVAAAAAASTPARTASPAAVASAVPSANAPAVAPNGANLERWQATNVPNAPWMFEFTIAGTTMVGTVRQSGAPREAVTIAAGKTEGSNLSFKVLSPDGERVIAFTGQINGNQISFVRQITPLAGGSRGGNDLYGGLAPLQFVANRVTVAAAAVPSATPANARLVGVRGMNVDIAAVANNPNLQQMLDSLSRQVEIVDLAVPDPAKNAFFKSIPLTWPANAPASGDNAAYGAGRVVLQSQIYSPEKPVLLHELLHAYHEQRLANGFANGDIQRLYDQAKSSGQFPAGSYMLSNRGEYFAMMGSVYLNGTAARDPFTRQAILEMQPEFYQWMVKEFGPR